MLEQADTRKQVAEAVDNLLLRVTDDIRARQDELRRKYPRMTALPPPVQIDPNLIRDFTQTQAYREAVDDYLHGRTAENLVVTVFRLLRALAPAVFDGL